MANSYFQFKKFRIEQDRCAMKVTTDSCLFGAWASRQIDHLDSSATSALDIGTGSGLLPLMIVQEHPLLTFDAVELDTSAALQAGENVKNSDYEHSINIINEDIKEFQVNHPYDLVISNPPFYENELKSGSPAKDQAHHSTSLKMVDVFRLAKTFLKPGGHLLLLLPWKRQIEAEAIAASNDLHVSQKCHVRESRSHAFTRTMMIATSNGMTNPCIETSMEIRSSPGTYSEEFTALLRPYYLHL